MNPQAIQNLAALFAAMAAFLGGMHLVMTRPTVSAIGQIGKRLDETNQRISDLKADLGKRLDRIEARLDKIEERLSSVERKVEALELKAWR